MEENPTPTTNRNTRQSRSKKGETNEKVVDRAGRKKKTDANDVTTSKEVS